MKDIVDHFGTTISKDFFRTFVGQQLGFGCFREVYECVIDPSLVVKIESDSRSFHNIQEWDVWERVKYTQYKGWLAPCEYISPCGIILIQKKTECIGEHDLPRFVPNWLTDFKKDNWGMLNGKVVCHDYGNNLTMENGISKKVRSAEWR